MAKSYYKIPTALDKTVLDVEVALQKDDGVGLKPLSMRTIISYILSAFTCLYFVIKTFMSYAPILTKIMFIILWIAMTHLLCSYTKTKDMAWVQVPAYLNYVGKKNRKLFTRNKSRVKPIYDFYNIDSINNETGLITFVDKTYGSMYRVVGNASVLLFEQDRDLILDRVDSFYRKLGLDVEVITITTKESQKVYKQMANLKKQFDALEIRDPDLIKLQEEKFDILKHHVGDNYRSIHQYIILKADNAESLRSAVNSLLYEVENSSLMFKQCVHLLGEDIESVLSSIYKNSFSKF